MALVSAVLFVAARRDHPIGHVFEVIACVGNVHAGPTNETDFAYRFEGFWEVYNVLDWELWGWKVVVGWV
jgi:hypothetical protein